MYVTQDEFEREIPFDGLDFDLDPDDWDSLVEDVLKRESERIQEWLSPQGGEVAFEQKSTTEQLNGSGGDVLPLPKQPAKSVESLEINGELVDDSDFWVEDKQIRLKPDSDVGVFPETFRSVTVEWTYGYDEVPRVVKSGVIRLARHGIDQIRSDGIESESAGDGSVTYTTPSELREDVYSNVSSYGSGAYVGRFTAI